MKRALVTGASGFVGRYLVQALAEAGWEVIGHTGPRNSPPAGLPVTRWISEDLSDAGGPERLVEATRPDAVLHLAAVSFPPDASRAPEVALSVNTLAAARLVAALKERRRAGTLDPVVLVVGSAYQYGFCTGDTPLTEHSPLRPASVYAASKAAQELFALEAFRSEGLKVVVTRSFNHSGPGQSPTFLLPALVSRAVHARQNGTALQVGNTRPTRDFLHVADVADAYLRLIQRGTPGEAYNVSSGVGITVGTIAERVAALAGGLVVESAPSLQRSEDEPILVGDSTKLRQHTGWHPRHSFDHLLEELLRDAEAH